MIEHVIAMYGVGCAITTITYLTFCVRAAEVPYND
jgi:hypothetical protein